MVLDLDQELITQDPSYYQYREICRTQHKKERLHAYQANIDMIKSYYLRIVPREFNLANLISVQGGPYWTLTKNLV